MTEEVIVTDPVEDQVESTEPEVTDEVPEVTVSPLENEAREGGWKPLEEYEGDPDKWVDAKEFVRRGELFGKIDHLNKDLKDTKKALRALQAHHASVREVEYKRALDQLKADKKQALEEGDADRLIEIDDKLAEARAEQKAAQQQAVSQANTPHPGFVAWVGKNKWYAENPELRSVADQIGTSYSAANPEIDPDTVLAYVEKRVKKVYPDYFSNPNKTRLSAVESSSTAPTRKLPSKEYELSDEERKVMNTFVRQEIMTKEEYIAQLKAIKGEV